MRVDDNLSLRDAVRGRQTTPKPPTGGSGAAPAATPTSTSTTPSGTDLPNRSERPARSGGSRPGSSTGERSNASAPGERPNVSERPLKTPQSIPTAPVEGENDGRAEQLNSGGHRGTRDERIAELRASQAQLRAEEQEIEDDIDDLEDEIGRDSTITSGVRTGTEIATSGVGFVFGLFGKENPIAEGAENVTEFVTGLQGDKEELEERETDLEKQQSEIETEIRKLETEQVLNFLADTAHVTDMDDEVADFLEEGRQQVGGLDVRMRVLDEETDSGGDGVFDASDNTVTVSGAIIEDAGRALDVLQAQGIVDGDGNIIDAERFDRSSVGDDVIKSVSVVGVHEINHAVQHAEGTFAPAFEAKEQVAREVLAELLSDDTTVDDATAHVGTALAAGEAVRTQQIEVESYQLQEQNDLRAGASKKAFITIDANGNPLPAEQQLANVLAYQAAEPLPHGPSAGYQREGESLNVAGLGGHSHDDGHDHGGLEADGRRGPGRRGPGLEADGRRGPGLEADAIVANALEADGRRGPGRRGPGLEADGFLADALLANALEADGRRGPGRRGPGLEADGFSADAIVANALLADALSADGRRGPGRRGPGLEADAIIANALLADALSADGRRGPGRRGPGVSAD